MRKPLTSCMFDESGKLKDGCGFVERIGFQIFRN